MASFLKTYPNCQVIAKQSLQKELGISAFLKVFHSQKLSAGEPYNEEKSIALACTGLCFLVTLNEVNVGSNNSKRYS